MNCHGDETWNEVVVVTKLFLKGHIPLGKQKAPVRDLHLEAKSQTFPSGPGALSVSFFHFFFFF